MTEKELLKMLTWAFTCGVSVKDIPYIRYKAYRKKDKVVSLYLTDVDHRLGNMWVALSKSELDCTQYENLDLGELLEFLIKHGAKQKPREKRIRLTSYYD